MRERVWRRVQVMAIVTMLLATGRVGWAQPGSRTLHGLVVDPAGLPVPEARVHVEADDAPLAAARGAISDAAGQFAIVVPAGEVVRVLVERPRFLPSRHVVAPDDTSPLRIVLALAPIEERLAVTRPVIDATTADPFGATTTIVSAAQVEALNAVDLASALRRTPGVTISRFNPVGAFGGEAGGAVFVRGTGMSRPGSEIKAYVDDVPFYMGIWGHPLLDLLPVSGLDSVAVHKGPQPQAFGNAFAAIALSTRRARADGVSASLRASGGAFGTVVQQGELALRAGRWDLAVSQGLARSDGHRPAADGRLASGTARVGWQPTPGWTVSATTLLVDNDASDPGVSGRPETRAGRFATSGLLGAIAVAHTASRVQGRLQVYANRGEGNWRGQPAPDGDTRTRFALAGVRWREAVRAWGDVHVSAGLDVDRIDGDVQFDRVAPAPRTRFDPEALRLVSPHIAVDRVFSVGRGWSVQPSAGVRVYEHSVFASANAPHGGLVVRRGDVLALRVNRSRGLSYPGQEVVALSELIPALGASWRQLAPEDVDHVEVGGAFTPRAGTALDVAWFRDAYANRYVFAFPPVVARPTFANLGRHRIRGLEATLHQDLVRGWRAFTGVTLLDASLSQLPYVPERAIVAGLTGQLGPVRVALDLQHQTSMAVLARARSGAGADPARVDGFTVVNARPSWVVPRGDGRVELFLALENLFDAAYAYRPGYPMPGASALVGVIIRTKR